MLAMMETNEGVTSNIGVRGSNFREVQCHLSMVDCHRDSEFTSAPRLSGCTGHQAKSCTFQQSMRRSKKETSKKFNGA